MKYVSGAVFCRTSLCTDGGMTELATFLLAVVGTSLALGSELAPFPSLIRMQTAVLRLVGRSSLPFVLTEGSFPARFADGHDDVI